MALIEVKPTVSKGLGLFAQQPIARGGTICKLEYPIMSDIESEHLPIACYYCLLSEWSDFGEDLEDFAPFYLNRCHDARWSGTAAKIAKQEHGQNTTNMSASYTALLGRKL